MDEETQELPSKPTLNITYCPICKTTIVGMTPKEHMEEHAPSMKTTIRVVPSEPYRAKGITTTSSIPYRIHIASPMEARDIKEMPPECKACAFWVGCPYKFMSKGHCTRIT